MWEQEQMIIGVDSNGEWLGMNNEEGSVSFYELSDEKVALLYGAHPDSVRRILARHGEPLLDVWVQDGKLQTEP